MAAPFGYGLWLFLKNNPVVAYIAGGVAALAAFLSWQRLRDMRIRKEERKKIIAKVEEENRRQVERAEEYIETVKQEAADAAEKAIESRDTAGPLDPDGMSDAQYARIFGRRRPSEGGS